MKITIDIQNCRECPFSSGGDTKHPHESWVCDKLSDNIGAGDTVFEGCPLVGETIEVDLPLVGAKKGVVG